MVDLAWKLLDVTWYRALTYCGLGEIKFAAYETWQLRNSNTADENIDIDINVDFKVDVDDVDIYYDEMFVCFYLFLPPPVKTWLFMFPGWFSMIQGPFI